VLRTRCLHGCQGPVAIIAVIAPVPQVRRATTRATSNEPRSLHAEHGALGGQAGPIHLDHTCGPGAVMRQRGRGALCFGLAEAHDRPVGRFLLGGARAGPHGRCPECLNIILRLESGSRPQVRIKELLALGDGGRLPAGVRGGKIAAARPTMTVSGW
jgi:hypothetical protein